MKMSRVVAVDQVRYGSGLGQKRQREGIISPTTDTGTANAFGSGHELNKFAEVERPILVVVSLFYRSIYRFLWVPKRGQCNGELRGPKRPVPIFIESRKGLLQHCSLPQRQLNRQGTSAPPADTLHEGIWTCKGLL